jgi:hypothetical protein
MIDSGGSALDRSSPALTKTKRQLYHECNDRFFPSVVEVVLPGLCMYTCTQPKICTQNILQNIFCSKMREIYTIMALKGCKLNQLQ